MSNIFSTVRLEIGKGGAPLAWQSKIYELYSNFKDRAASHCMVEYLTSSEVDTKARDDGFVASRSSTRMARAVTMRLC